MCIVCIEENVECIYQFFSITIRLTVLLKVYKDISSMLKSLINI